VGFDWKNIDGVIEKVVEELQEIQNAPDAKKRAQEIGDLLFSAVNLARWLGIDAESVLRETNARFRRRFGYLERAIQAEGRNFSDVSLDELNAYWEEAKRDEE